MIAKSHCRNNIKRAGRYCQMLLLREPCRRLRLRAQSEFRASAKESHSAHFFDFGFALSAANLTDAEAVLGLRVRYLGEESNKVDYSYT